MCGSGNASCGKYFILKGKYDTNYCDCMALGKTKNCRELAAIGNYKAKRQISRSGNTRHQPCVTTVLEAKSQ